MAATVTLATARPAAHSTSAAMRSALALFICSALPLGLFGLAELGAGTLGISSFFFAPFGMTVWMGAALHLAQLALLGAAFWAVSETGSTGSARFWLAGLIAAYIVLPYATPALDSLQLGLVCTALFLLALATLRRVGAASPLAGWMMAPMLAVLGFSAAMGLAVAAAYSPPFALTQGNQGAPAA